MNFFNFIPYPIMVSILFLIKIKYKGDNSVKKRNGDSPLKRPGPDCTCANNTDYFIARF